MTSPSERTALITGASTGSQVRFSVAAAGQPWPALESARSHRWSWLDAELRFEGVVHLHDLWGVELI